MVNARCETNKGTINWTTEQEQNINYFNVEKSLDGGASWAITSIVPATGNSSTPINYSVTDNPFAVNSLYRIAEYGINGQQYYTSAIQPDCNRQEQWQAWPNPVQGILTVAITSPGTSQATIQVVDNKGALLKTQVNTLLAGNNLLTWRPVLTKLTST
ncbi:MAG: hypothetical protein WDN26_24560 [Chitinophagaceae bacterium]